MGLPPERVPGLIVRPGGRMGKAGGRMVVLFFLAPYPALFREEEGVDDEMDGLFHRLFHQKRGFLK
jgi:hypothetical protein